MSLSVTERPAVATRAATAADLEALGQIWHQMMLEHQGRDSAFQLAADAVSQWHTMAVDLLDRSDAFVWVASAAGDGEGHDGEGHGATPVHGFCLGWIARNPAVYALQRVGFISELGVLPAQRRRGVGRALVRRAAQWFRAQGLSEYQLSTAHWNDEARAFWEAVGGQPLLVRYRFALPGDGGAR